jgi:hypothetical protein
LLETNHAAVGALATDFQIATGLNRQRVSLFRSKEKPPCGFLGVAVDAIPVVVGNTKVVLRSLKALVGCHAKVSNGFALVLGHHNTFLETHPDVPLRFSMALFGGHAVVSDRLSLIFGNSLAIIETARG